MNKRKACLVGLAAGATLLAGCVAQYQNPSACEQQMRARLANASLGDLSVTHTAVAYRGKRVVVEGSLARGALPASGVLSPAAVAAVSGEPALATVATVGASGVSAASASEASSSTGASATRGASAPSAAPMTPAAQRSTLASAASGASGAAAATAASAASAPAAASKPATPMALLAVKLGLHKAPRPSVAAECTYDKTGSLTSFRWLSPAVLAKTTPAPDADDE